MKINKAGQITIPQHVLQQLNLKPGAEIKIRVEGNGAKIIPVGKGRVGRELIERMRGSGSGNMTTDEIMALTRGTND